MLKKYGKYFKVHDLNVQCDTLLLAEVFENFRDKCIEIYGLDPARFCQHQDQHGQLTYKRQE